MLICSEIFRSRREFDKDSEISRLWKVSLNNMQTTCNDISLWSGINQVTDILIRIELERIEKLTQWVLSIPQWVWLLGSNRWQRSWRKSFLPMCWQFRSNSSSSFETGRRIHTKICNREQRKCLFFVLANLIGITRYFTWWMTNRYKFHICTFLPAWCRCSSHGRGNIHPSRNWFPSLYSWKRYCRPRTISYLAIAIIQN